MSVIRELRLDRFKAFERFTLTLGKATFLVGPNNAGKSTLIGAMRLGAQLLRLAYQRNPERAATDSGIQYIAYGIDTERLGLPEPVMRHEFRQLETRLRLTFHDRAALTAVWPATEVDVEDGDDVSSPYFYLRNGEGRQPHRAGEVRRWFPAVGVVPVLSPLDTNEELLSVDHIRANSDGRLASRHFRNHLWMLQSGDWPGFASDAYDEFLDFAAKWTPEIVLRGVEPRIVPGKGRELDLWYTDRGRAAYKELCWVGDGIQIWLQILLHLFRLRESSTIVLDEPDVYLHADMQRRLVRLLESLPAQTIMATHSAEILGEAAADSVTWVDKSKRRSVRAKNPDVLSTAADALGSQFNVRIAKALRSKLALFVEGQDMRILSLVAKTAGAARIATEDGIAVVPLGGFSRWEHAEAFSWLAKDLLGGAIQVNVILDRDYRPEATIKPIEKKLADSGIACHVWRRKELESYLLHAAAIGRSSGADEVTAASILAAEVEEHEQYVRSRMTTAALEEGRRRREQDAIVIERCNREFDARWADPEQRLELAPAKDVLSGVNRRLVEAGVRPVSPRTLARSLRIDEIPDEMLQLLREVNEAV